MKRLIILIVCLTGLLPAQDKPRVFVQGKGSQDLVTSGGKWSSNTTIDSHDESMEVSKDLEKNCADVVVTVNQSNADYTVILNRESKHNRGLLRTNSQVQVANRLGDILGTNSTRTVGNASKDACQLIRADWSQHGGMAVPNSPTAVPIASRAPTAKIQAPADRAKVQTVSAIPPSTAPVAGASANAAKVDEGNGSFGDTAPKSITSVRTVEVTAEISSDPLGADIEIDGNFVGSTPSSLGIAPGEHTLRVTKQGYKRWERTLRSSTGNIKVEAVLELIPVALAETNLAATKIRHDTNSPDTPPSRGVHGAEVSKDDSGHAIVAATSIVRDPALPPDSPTSFPGEALIGVWFTGNPTVRHDGVEISGVQPRGPADNIDIKPGDVLLAIDDHYLFTIDETRAELLRHEPGARLRIRYRHHQLISENYLTLGPAKETGPLK